MNFMRVLSWIIVLVFMGTNVKAQVKFELPNDSLKLISEKNWIYPDNGYAAELDGYYRKLFSIKKSFFEEEKTNKYGFSKDSVPAYPPQVIKERLKKIDSLSPLPLVYNYPVAKMISFYVYQRRGMLSRVSGLSELYYPLFEAELVKANLPMELKHLAVVESALINVNRSHMGAVGLWQFMYNTGEYLGLRIDSYIDERRDPLKSTQTAVKYLKYLHSLYDDWYMALAAYNAGPGNINKAIRRSGGKKTFWEIYEFIPDETKNYVPAFIAVNYAMNYLEEHNIEATRPRFNFNEIDTIHVKQPVYFSQLSEVLCIDIEELQFLNPQYKTDFIPFSAHSKKSFPLVLPYYLIGEFIINESVIYRFKSDTIEEEQDSVVGKVKAVHVVKTGENINSVAGKYNVTSEQIKIWNNMSSNTIHPEQRLFIYDTLTVVSIPKFETVKSAETATKVKEQNVYYKVKRGDSLSKIAQKHKGVSVEKILEYNKMKKSDNLIPGTKIIINKK